MAKAIVRKKRRAYHHGNLQEALLAAAEKILEKDGIQQLTLRAVARAVGVSHTAPQNHFDDLTALLSELAAVGFHRFAAALRAAADAAGDDPLLRNRATGGAYVRFALAHPGLFTLMYRSERLDPARPALRDAIEASRQVLRATTPPAANPPSPLRLAAAGAARWSLVHGFAVLLIDGRLEGLMRSIPGGISPDALLDAMFDVARIDPSAP